MIAPLTFDQLTEIVLMAPGVETGFIQDTRALDPKRGLKDGGQEAPTYVLWNNQVRVCLYSGGKHADETRGTCMDAVTAAFAKLGIALPPSLQPHTTDEHFIAWGIEEVIRERRFHPRFVVNVAFLRARLFVDDPRARAILSAIEAKTKLKEEEESKR